jgi:hypothetical protein
MTIVTSQRIFLPSQSEDFESQSSYECSKPLRQILYGVLLKDYGKTAVEEYGRHREVSSTPSSERSGGNIVCESVPVCSNVGCYPVPGLAEIPEMSEADRRKLLESALEMGNAFDDFGPDMKILLGMTSFWYKHATPKVSSSHLSSLIVCWIMLKIQNPNRSPNDNIIDKAVDASGPGILKRITMNLDRYCSPSASKIRFDIVHAYAQFQTCLMSAHDLNSILRYPYPNFDIQNLFFGKFLHDFCLTIDEEPDKDRFVCEILVEDSKFSRLYERIIHKF